MHHVILGLLLTEALSLYDVQKRFASGLAHFYSASSGSIERALRRLVDDGTATVSDDPSSARRRRVYRITETGHAAWREWMHAPTPAGADIETTALAKVFLLGRLDDPRDQVTVLRSIRREAEQARAALATLAATVDARAAELDAAAERLFAPQRSTLDYGLRAHDMLIAWLIEREEVLS